MSQICPYCYSEIPRPAVICPYCTRDTRFPEAVFGPPLTPGGKVEHARMQCSAIGSSTALRLLFVVPLALLAGLPLLPILLVAGVLVGLAMLISRAASASRPGD